MKREIASASLFLLVTAGALAGACGSDPASPPTPVAGRGGGSGGSDGAAGTGGAADAARDAPASTPDTPPFAPTPSNLPILLFEVPGAPLQTLGEAKVSGSLKVVEAQGAQPGTASNVGLRLVATVASPGSFSFELRDASDQPRKDALLGLPNQGDWIVQVCGTADKPCVRNLLGFDIAAKLGPGVLPRIRLIEVYYNEEYQGLFQLIAPAAKLQGRVQDLPDPADGMGDAVSGGYVIRRNGAGVSPPTVTPPREFVSATEAPGPFPHRMVYSYLSPDPAALTAAQRTYIESHIAAFEAAMKAPNFANPTTGYPSWIDTDSFSDFFILAEVSNNIDSYWRNIVLTKPRDSGATRGKLSATPFWDFSIGFGLAEVRSGWRPDKLTFEAANSAVSSSYVPGGECAAPANERLPRGAPLCGPTCCMGGAFCQLPARCWNAPYRPFWWDQLQSDAAFRNQTRCRYRQLRQPGGAFDMARIDGLIADWKSQLGAGAFARHLERAPILREFQFPFNPYRMDPRTAPDPVATPQAFLDKEVKWFRDWLEARLRWLDDNLPGVCAAVNEGQRDAGAPPDPSPPAVEPVQLAQGLVGYWNLDETTGQMARDSSPLMNHGTLMGFRPTDVVPGSTGNGLNFDPMVAPVVVVPDAPALNPTTAISIGAWIRATDWSGNRRLAQKGDNDDQYRLTAEGGLLKFHLTGVTGGNLEAILPSTGMPHHVMGTFDGKRIRIYIDGNIQAQDDSASGTIGVTPSNLHIGLKRVGAPNVDSFSGVLDDVVIYNRALNATEVRRLAAGTKPL
jgi:hypothetical protein